MAARGYSVADDELVGPGNLSPWENLAVDAVGNVIDFWQFKRNHGRVWGLLYLRNKPHSAQELQDALGLSKGAVSMLTRELEQWGVIDRVRTPGDATWKFIAETNLMRMIGRVLAEREGAMVSRVRADLDEAESIAKRSNVPSDVLARIGRMRTLASIVDRALGAFLQTSKIDVGGFVGVLNEDTDLSEKHEKHEKPEKK